MRIGAATHRELPHEASRGRFRLDLYHRLAVGVIHLPPLRERARDIPALVRHFCRQLRQAGLQVELDAGAMATLTRHPWPGNVRELYGALCRAAADEGPRLGARAFSFLAERAAEIASAPPGYVRFRSRPFEEIRREVYLSTVARCGGNRTAAAAALGIPKSTFFDQLRMLEREGC